MLRYIFTIMGGIIPLLQTLKDLEKRGIPGKILTTDYQNFSEPRALRKLDELSNITLKMYQTNEAQEGFHTKGYIFKNEEFYRIIVGSSNLTLNALTKNKEWNTKVREYRENNRSTRKITSLKLWNIAEQTKEFKKLLEQQQLLEEKKRRMNGINLEGKL